MENPNRKRANSMSAPISSHISPQITHRPPPTFDANIPPPTRGRSHSTTMLSPPLTTHEFQQVVGPEIAPNRARRNSMPNPGSDTYKLAQFIHKPDPESPYLHHITHPDNLANIKKAGGLMPINLQPKRGQGLDQMTQRAAPSVSSTVKALVDLPDQILETNFNRFMSNKPLISQDEQQLLTTMKKSEAQLALREGANPDNLYMSKGTGSTKDYMTNYFQSGAVLLRTHASHNNQGFVKDQQGKADDMRGRGVVIPSSQLEFAHVSGQHMQTNYDKPDWQFKDLDWQPLTPQNRPRAQSLPPPRKKPL